MSDKQKIDDGGPAFAQCCSGGMSLRQWYAGQALAGMGFISACNEGQANANVDGPGIARACWKIADILLATQSEKGD